MYQPGSHLLARLRFRHLQLIAEVERTGSLTRAADALSLTQPALSKSLKEIEDILGFEIYHRSARGLQKTPQGVVLAQGVEVLLKQLQHIHEEAGAANSDASNAGILRLGSSAFIAVGLLPPIIAGITRRIPRISVRITEDNVPRLFEKLISGDLDALICIYSSEIMTSDNAKGLQFEKLYEEPYVVIAPAGHPLTKRSGITWESLSEEPWILTRKPSFARVLVEDRFGQHGIMMPTPICETDGPVTAARLVANGVGISSVPESTAREHLENKSIVMLRVQTPHPAATLGLVYRKTNASHPRIDLLRKELKLA